MSKNIPESRAVQLWQQQLQMQRRLTGLGGEKIEIVYPGRPNDTWGGDFRDAVINSNGQSNFGCIEIHTRTSHWRAHGHHRDPRYNQVVLHVALSSQTGEKAGTVLENGRTVPTIILDPSHLPDNPEKVPSSGLPCQNNRGQSRESRAAVLDRAGDLRFTTKACSYPIGQDSAKNGQILYTGVMEALGYTRNKDPFRELAQRVPLLVIEDILRAELPGEEVLSRLQALLLGSAGLLPSQRKIVSFPEQTIQKLETNWAAFSSSSAMSWRDWELFKVRPGNYPVRRIAALSYLLYRYREKGWLPSLLGLVRRAAGCRERYKLESALTVTARGYWTSHYDFGASSSSINAVLLGQQRAAEIVVNVLLPFTWAWEQKAAGSKSSRSVLENYIRHPRLGTNSIEKHMVRQLSLPEDLINSARRQQGLVHIYKTLCTQGKCAECDFR